MPDSFHATVRGIGHYVPEKVRTNADFEKTLDTSDEWIVTRTGIRERRLAAPGQCVSDLALEASRAALADAGLTAGDLTHIMVATLTPDYYCPSSASVLQHKLGVPGIPALDVNAACTGFLYTLEQARATICLHPESVVLVVPSEVLSSRTNWEDRSTAVLFGDGAGAVILSGPDTLPDAPKRGLLRDVLLRCDGAASECLTVRGGGSARPYSIREAVGEDFFIQMEGREVFKHAVRNMEGIANEMLAKHGLTTANVDLFVPHQANLRIIEAVGDRLGFDRETVFANVQRYGNTSAASVAIALSEARDQGRIPEGGTVLAVSFGGGFTWGAALFSF